ILEFSESALPGARVLNPRLLVKRSGLETFLHDSASIDLDHSVVNESALWEKLWRQFENIFREAQARPERESWRYVRHRSDIPRCERWLLRGSGKSRDGFVSRYLNRPISRAVSQLLLKTPMTPNLWTLLITILPVIGFFYRRRPNICIYRSASRAGPRPRPSSPRTGGGGVLKERRPVAAVRRTIFR